MGSKVWANSLADTKSPAAKRARGLELKRLEDVSCWNGLVFRSDRDCCFPEHRFQVHSVVGFRAVWDFGAQEQDSSEALIG